MLIKKRLFLLVAFLVLAASNLSAQSIELFDRFMRNIGGEVIANIAHPSNTYSGCSYEIGEGNIIVTVSYREGYTTCVKLSAKGPIFYNLEVLSDSDFFPPFLASQGLKNVLYEVFESENPDLIKNIESVVGRRIRDMDGYQLCCTMFTISFLNHYAKNNY